MYNLWTLRFHQSQHIKNNGNINILPNIIVANKSIVFTGFICVPVILIRNDLYFYICYWDNYDTNVFNEYALPLNENTYGFVVYAYGE